MAAIALLSSCQSDVEDALVEPSSDLVEVSLGMVGEFSDEDAVLTRGSHDFEYYVAISANAASAGKISSGFVGRFTSLTDVTVSLQKGTTYNFYISAFESAGATADLSTLCATQGEFVEINSATPCAPDFADTKVDRYYGSTSEEIVTNTTVSVSGKRFAYGINVNIETPLEGKVVMSSESPAFTYTVTSIDEAKVENNIFCLAGINENASKETSVTVKWYDASNNELSSVTKILTIARNHMRTLKVKALDPNVDFDFIVGEEDMEGDGDTDLIATFHNGHQYVDMGFPNNVLWAACNIGASCPEEVGDYYAWGELITKTEYSATTWNYITEVSIKETDKDVAHVKWGGNWYMPDSNDWKYFADGTYVTWSNETRNGVSGRLATSIINGNSIFFPISGVMEGSSLTANRGNYWVSDRESTSVSTKGAKQAFITGSSAGYSGSTYAYYGLPVRPVCKLQ